MPRRPSVSIVVSSYNYAEFLRQAIDSALAQTYPATVVVVDDGSTDDSRSIIRDFGDTVRPIFKENGGQASAFNVGARSTEADVVIFLDSDDVLLPTAVERAVEQFADDSVSKVHWPLVEMNRAGELMDRRYPPEPLLGGDLAERVARLGPKGYVWPPTSGNAWSRRFLDRVLPIPEHLFVTCPDLYLCAAAPLMGRVGVVTEPQGCWRVHGANSSWSDPLDRRIELQHRMWDYAFDVIERLCAERGLACDRPAMSRASYWHQAYHYGRAITRAVPAGEAFVLIDEGGLRLHEPVWGRRPVDFSQGEASWGEYWGPPPDDPTAVREFEKRRAAGATYAVIVRPSFWWLDHFVEFRRHLEREYREVCRNEDLVAFDLRK